MVLLAPLLGAAVFLSGLTAALPTQDYGSSKDSGSSNYGSSGDSGNMYGGGNSNYGGSGGCGGSDCGAPKEAASTKMMEKATTSMMMEKATSTSMMMDKPKTTMMDKPKTTMMDKATSTMMMEKPATKMMEKSTTMMMEKPATKMMEKSTTTAMAGYQDCVNQCIATFGGKSGGGSYQATATSGTGGSKGKGGATHTVLVAPTKGVFRMMPFATNASVGDTIEFHWGADNHTVTKSSQLTPCNKSSDAPVFLSGQQSKGFVFSQVVNDTKPTFYFCGTPTHCQKGMFGIINPTMATPGAPSSLGGMMQSMAANDSNLAAYAAYTNNATASNNAASTWGSNFDMASMPEWSRSLFATNVLYTRAAIAMNKEILKPDNSIDLSSVSGTPLMLPMDISTALNAASAPPAAAPPSAAAAGAAQTAPAGAAQSSPAAKPNGASAIASPRFLVGAVVVIATIFAL
ncbi:glycoamidase [Mycena belliarum]|uniref:Glycoamidase n=1 Tax=Mycena belliarum TaxID=1033014 RepID=A0AAD6XYW0_9AGAR|nr:glycoamidase [Mycena belliae]